MTNPIEALNDAFGQMQGQIERLEESLAQKVLALEDIGWTKLTGQSDEDTGLTLDALKELTPNLRDMAAVNPLLKRGAQLRHSYVFGRGINFTGIERPKVKTALTDLYNKSTLFSVEAHSVLNLAKYTDGNVFVIRDEQNNVFTLVPLSQISAVVTDPDDAAKIRYLRRSWTANGKTNNVWYPLARFKKSQIGRGRRGGKINKTINIGGVSQPVAQDSVIYHATSNRQVGWTFGIPDCLAAALHTVAYSEYLADSASLVKALQQIAWTVQSATKNGAKNAAIGIAQPGVGGTASMTSGNVLSSAGVPSAQVNFNNGQPLAAMVATALGVPVIALLSSPGATGGSYGAATTLDEPTLKGMAAVQDEWRGFFEEILTDIGAQDPEAAFPNISQDQTYREAQSIATAYTTGLLHQDEARNATLDLLDVRKTRESMPKPDNFNAGTDPNDSTDPTASQGNTGAVAGGTNQDTTDHSSDTNNSSGN